MLLQLFVAFVTVAFAAVAALMAVLFLFLFLTLCLSLDVYLFLSLSLSLSHTHTHTLKHTLYIILSFAIITAFDRVVDECGNALGTWCFILKRK